MINLASKTKDKINLLLNKRELSGRRYYKGTLTELLKNENIWEKSVHDFYKIAKGNFDYFKFLYESMNNIPKEELKGLLTEFLFTRKDVYDLCIIYRFMEDFEVLSSRDVKNYLITISRINNINMKYCLNIDIQSYVFRHKDSLYDNYYNDRRKILQSIAEAYWGNRNLNFRNNDSSRIAVSAKILEGEKSATANYIFDDVLALVRKGMEVEIFVTGYFYYNDADSYLKPKFPQDDVSIKYKNFHKQATEGKIKIHYARGNTIEERFGNFINDIVKYNPAAIIDYSGQHGFETAILTKLYPVLYIPTTGFAFNDFFHRFMCSDKTVCLKENEKYHSISEDQIVEYDKPIRNKKARRQFHRNEYCFKSDDFILVTVGVRIEFELEPECIDNICKVIASHENIRWLIVSPNKHDYIRNIYSNLCKQKKIIFWGVENDLVGLYGICNAYVNPNRTGGGASIAYAMHAGLPILMNYYASDALPYVGREVLTNSYEEMAEELERLVIDEHYYKQRKDATIERANRFNVDNSARQYIEAIKQMKKDIADGKLKI